MVPVGNSEILSEARNTDMTREISGDGILRYATFNLRGFLQAPMLGIFYTDLRQWWATVLRLILDPPPLLELGRSLDHASSVTSLQRDRKQYYNSICVRLFGEGRFVDGKIYTVDERIGLRRGDCSFHFWWSYKTWPSKISHLLYIEVLLNAALESHINPVREWRLTWLDARDSVRTWCRIEHDQTMFTVINNEHDIEAWMPKHEGPDKEGIFTCIQRHLWHIPTYAIIFWIGSPFSKGRLIF